MKKKVPFQVNKCIVGTLCSVLPILWYVINVFLSKRLSTRNFVLASNLKNKHQAIILLTTGMLFHKDTPPSYKSQSFPIKSLQSQVDKHTGSNKDYTPTELFSITLHLMAWIEVFSLLVRNFKHCIKGPLQFFLHLAFTLPKARDAVDSEIGVSIWLTAQWALCHLLLLLAKCYWFSWNWLWLQMAFQWTVA